MDARKFQSLSRNDDSFDVQDLIAEMNVDIKNLGLKFDNN